MTSEQHKEEIVRHVLQACYPCTDDRQRAQIENALHIALYGLNISKEETALSTEVLRPNEEILKQFIGIKMVKGLSHRSLKAYQYTITTFFRNTNNKPVEDITANDIRYYLAIRKARDGVSNVTLNNELRGLRTFFSTLHNEEIIPKNPTAKIDRIKTEKKTMEPFSELEIEKIRQTAMEEKQHTINSKRNVAIIEVLYSTGCRVGELVQIKRKDLQGDRIKVIGKGNKERFVYLNPRAQITVEAYLKNRTDNIEWLFPGGDWHTHEFTDFPITTGTIEQLIRRLGKKAGVEKAHPHRFRRTAATVALRRGMPIEQVSKMLGHEQLTTTQIYTKTDDEEVRNSHKKFLT